MIATTIDVERQDLLASIIDEPENDTPRLVYADWLDEHAGEEKCERCYGSGILSDSPLRPCPSCGGFIDDRGGTRRLALGTGRIYNGYAERAEFIRVQCRLSQTKSKCGSESGDFLCRSMSCAMCPLIRRQNELWLTRTVGEQFELTERTGFAFTIFASPGDFPPPVIHVRRGFIDSVICPMKSWLQHGPAICREHPVINIDITDKEPECYQDIEPAPDYWVWWKSAHDAPLIVWCDLPKHIWDHLQFTDGTRNIARYPTQEDARLALSRACIVWARSQG